MEKYRSSSAITAVQTEQKSTISRSLNTCSEIPEGTAEFSHLTHTIDISSLEKNTTAPQVLTNFNPLSAKEAQKDAMFKRSLLITLGLIAIGLFSLVVLVLVKILSK